MTLPLKHQVVWQEFDVYNVAHFSQHEAIVYANLQTFCRRIPSPRVRAHLKLRQTLARKLHV